MAALAYHVTSTEVENHVFKTIELHLWTNHIDKVVTF